MYLHVTRIQVKHVVGEIDDKSERVPRYFEVVGGRENFEFYKRTGTRYSCYLPLQWRHNGLDSVSNHQPHHCLLSRWFGRRSKKTSKLLITGLCAGNSPVNGEFPAQMASNAENISIWWRHHATPYTQHHEMRKSALKGSLIYYEGNPIHWLWMLPYWRNCHRWLYRKLLFWHLSVQSVLKMLLTRYFPSQCWCKTNNCNTPHSSHPKWIMTLSYILKSWLISEYSVISSQVWFIVWQKIYDKMGTSNTLLTHSRVRKYSAKVHTINKRILIRCQGHAAVLWNSLCVCISHGSNQLLHKCVN